MNGGGVNKTGVVVFGIGFFLSASCLRMVAGRVRSGIWLVGLGVG